MAEVGVTDSRKKRSTTRLRLADGRSDPELIARYIDIAPEMVRFVEEQTPIRFQALGRYPDYHPEFQGGKPGGRSLDPGLFDTNRLGAWKAKLRRSPIFGMTAMSVAEATEWGVFSSRSSCPSSCSASVTRRAWSATAGRSPEACTRRCSIAASSRSSRARRAS